MSEHLGEEFIKISPDASGFRAALQAQVATALSGVQQQVTVAQRELSNVAQQTTTAGIVIPPGVRSIQTETANATKATAAATTQAGTAAKRTSDELTTLSTSTRKATQTTQQLQREILGVESAAGRYTRGMAAATAASTGFFRAVSFASGAFLIGATIGATIGRAIQEFGQMTIVAAQTTALIRATGGSANVTARQVDDLAQRTLKLTGVDDELVKQSANVLLTFRSIRNEVGAGNDVFNRAVKATLDISSVFRTDLRGSAVQLGKALQDPERGVTALRRSGITLTQGQRDLIKEMVRSGRTLQAQKLILGEVERQVGGTAEAIGRTLPGRLRIMREEAVNSLGELVKRLSESRQAANFAAGAQQGLSETFGAAAAVIRAIGPSLVQVASGFGRVTSAIGGVGAIIAAVAAYKAIRVAAAAASTATNLFAAASAGAAQASLIQAEAAEAEAVAALEAATAQGLGTKALAGKAASAAAATAALRTEAAAEVTAGRAAQAHLSALTALSAIFAVGAAASGHWELALTAGGFALAGMGTKALAAVRALRAAGTAITAARVASLALGGPLGIAALAAGGLALAGLKIWQNWRNVPSALDRARTALDAINQSLDTNLRLRAAVGGARERLGVARFDEQGAQRELERAQRAQARSPAQPGSIEARFLAQEVTRAEQELAKAHIAVAKAQAEVDAAVDRARVHDQRRPAEIQRLTKALQEQISVLTSGRLSIFQGRIASFSAAFQRQGESADEALAHARRVVDEQIRGSGQGQRAVDDVAKVWQGLAQSEKGAGREAAASVFTILTQLNRLPNRREISVIVDLSQRGVKVNQILTVLNSLRNLPDAQVQVVLNLVQRGANLDEILTKLRQLGALNKSDSEQRVLESHAQTQINESLRVQRQELQGVLRAERSKLNVLSQEKQKRRDALDTARLERQAASDALESAREGREAAIEGLASAQDSLAEAHTNLADTVRQASESIAAAIKSAHEAVNDAIKSAKTNLDSLGQAVADALAKFSDAGEQTSKGLGPRLRQLREQILGGRGNFQTARAAQEVAFRLQADAPEIDTSKIQQQFADLTNAINEGKLTLPQFTKRLNDLLKGFNLNQFRKQFGTAATSLLVAQINALRRQARINLAAPRRPGGANFPELVRPLEAVARGTRDIATARRDAAREIGQAQKTLAGAVKTVTKAETDIVKSNRQVTAAERRLRQAESKERRANTRWVQENAKWTKQLAITLRARNRLLDAQPTTKPKPKPTGERSQVATGLHAHGATSP